MRVIVLGSGVIGVTSAYYLARDGHEVVVVDRQPGPALETSHANAGQVSPGYSAPWAAPGIPLKALKWLFTKYAPLVIRPTFDPAMWRWLLQMLRNCTHDRYEINKGRMVRLAEYSRDCLQGLRGEAGLHYDQGTRGTLQLFRNAKQLAAAQADIAVLERYGVRHELLDADGCVAAEPALARVQGKLVGGLRLPGDETGDCYAFTTQLAERAAALGVRFDYGVGIERLVSTPRGIDGVITDRGVYQGDAYVVALGSYAPRLLAPLGIDLPVYPVKGYSITVPVTDPAAAPVSTVMDETYKVAVTRLGDRIRVGGTAELAGFDLRLREERRRVAEHVVTDLFPDGGDIASAEFWCGLRPMTPDGTPVVGPTALPNLYLNTGHGTLGWTMACGSGRLLADQVGGRQPAISTEGLALERYHGACARAPRPLQGPRP
ncbi:MAG TPA: D-amino acid dehydrogenase, partial [Gammaproteobacteria bacterium]